MFLIFNPHTTPTATPGQLVTQIYHRTESYPRCPKAESCMWATEPAPLKHWGRAGGWQTATVQAASAVPAHTASSVPLPETQIHTPWYLCCCRTSYSPSMWPAGCAAPLSPYEHTLGFRISALWLVPQAVCASPLQTRACMHHSWNRQKLYFGWDRVKGLLTNHTLELWAWEMYHNCLQWALFKFIQIAKLVLWFPALIVCHNICSLSNRLVLGVQSSKPCQQNQGDSVVMSQHFCPSACSQPPPGCAPPATSAADCLSAIVQTVPPFGGHIKWKLVLSRAVVHEDR